MVGRLQQELRAQQETIKRQGIKIDKQELTIKSFQNNLEDTTKGTYNSALVH